VITSQNIQNNAKYANLFSKAWKALEKDLTEDEKKLDGFTRLEEYFTRMQTLTDKHIKEVEGISDIFDEKNNVYYAKFAKFLMLPLDETPFEINTNSRQITVPDNFRKYGVSLHGDQIAETLLFRVDRFFDFQDLLNTTILVQYTRPGKEPESEREGVDLITLVDYETEPGKIWFGWPLHDKITAGAGELKFSVRFMRKNPSTKNISYSLNTLTTQVTIKPALHPNFNESLTIDEASRLFTEAIVNSPSTGSTPALRPEFIVDLPAKAWLENDALKLAVSVKTGDTGVLNYIWHKADITGVDEKTGDFILQNGVTIPGKLELRPTTDTSVVLGKAYYLDSEDGAGIPYGDPIFPGVDENEQPIGVTENGATVYERYSVYEMPVAPGDVTGRYWVIATNRAGTSEERRSSAYCEVPAPKSLVFAKADALPVSVFVNADGSAQLSVKATPDDPDPKHTTLIYTWEKKDSIDGEYKVITKADGSPFIGGTLVLPKAEEDENPAKKNIGWYKVTAKSIVNRDSMECPSGYDCKVTAHATVPIITYPAAPVTLTKADDADENGIFDLTITLADKGGLLYSEYYTYTWFRSVTDGEAVEVKAGDPDIVTSAEVLEGHRNNTLQVKLAPNDEVEFYYCEVRNHLNGEDSSSVPTELFRVSAQ